MSLMKELSIEAEDELRDKIAEALTDYGFTQDDAENLADSCDIPWKLLHDETTDKRAIRPTITCRCAQSYYSRSQRCRGRRT